MNRTLLIISAITIAILLTGCAPGFYPTYIAIISGFGTVALIRRRGR